MSAGDVEALAYAMQHNYWCRFFCLVCFYHLQSLLF